MTKKDFELIARVMRVNREIVSEKFREDSEEYKKIKESILAYIDVISKSFSFELRVTNPSFDESRFLKACKYRGEA